jgi:DNA-binding response OmpR family regulator
MGQSRILIIDNNQIEAQFVGSHLKSQGFDITLAANVKDAFSLIVRELPDLILLDSKGEDGVNFCSKIRQFTEIPIIILSENNHKYEELKCLESGADDFLTKPLSVEILALKVKAVMRRRKTGTLTNSCQDELQITINLN